MRCPFQEDFDATTPTVEVKPIKTLEAGKKWLGLRWDRVKDDRRNKNGLAVVSDKSTDPLIHLSPSNTEDLLSATLSSNPVAAGLGDDEVCGL